MRFRFKARCDQVRINNGIVQALFTHSHGLAAAASQDEPVLVNVRKERGLPELGRDYWVSVEPAFPHARVLPIALAAGVLAGTALAAWWLTL